MEHGVDAAKPGLPISFPITSLSHLLDRSYLSSFDFPYNRSSVAFHNLSSKPDRPRLLACHDLRGGYQDDRFVQGSSNSQAYSLWHWNCVDVFVYFSHSLVTIPPPGWINAAHKHGVQVLGTFITEWEEGAKICQTLLDSEESVQIYALHLAELAQALGFDGWLINIENDILKNKSGNLIKFVQHLTVSMHTLVPSSLVIWYDAVTVDGKLDWQNCLNDKNHVFFDSCDGIFINYTWKEEYAKASAIAARDRKFDVYMGIDVFGRNTFGGGGFKCNVALNVAREAGVSAALFAPAWVYETKQGPNNREAEDKWWATIEACWDYVYRKQSRFPFYSDFNQGFGEVTYVDGVLVSTHPWSNLSCQNFQPWILFANKSQKCQLHVSSSAEKAVYSGGSSLRFVGDLQSKESCVVELFPFERISITAPLKISYSVLLGKASQFCLVLKLQNHNSNRFIFLTGENSIEVVKETSDHCNHPNVSLKCHYICHGMAKVNSSTVNQNMFVASQALKTDDTEKPGWCLRRYTLELHECSLASIYALTHVGELDYGKALELLEKNILKVDDLPSIQDDRISHKLDPAEKKRDILPNRKTMIEIKPLVEGSWKSKSYYALLGHISATLQPGDCFSRSESCKFYGSTIEWSQNSEAASFTSLELKWVFENEIHSQPKNSDQICDKSCNFVRYNVYFGTVYSVKNEAGLKSFDLDGFDHSEFQLQYLGASFVQAFYVDYLSVPKGTNLVLFRLQACCECGLAQDVKHTPLLALDVPSENSSIWKKSSNHTNKI